MLDNGTILFFSKLITYVCIYLKPKVSAYDSVKALKETTDAFIDY